MRTISFRLVVCLFSVGTLCVGCVSTTTVNGLQLAEDHWNQDLQTVRSRVAIDLSCPLDRIEIKPLDNFGGEGRIVSQVAATGCGKSAIYTRVDYRAGLALNSVQEK